MASIRRRAAKIIVSLTFDDVLDEYKLRISNFITILKGQPLTLMLYDLIGTFEGVESHAVSKYFYLKLKR